MMEPSSDESVPEVPASKEELEALFDAWDDRRAAEAEADAVPNALQRAWQVDPFRLWISVTLILVAIAGSAMWMTRHEVAYFLQRGNAPVDLGRLSERWRSGERELGVSSNLYVTARGMFSTYEAELTGEGERSSIVEHIYLCPLFNIAVRGPSSPPDKPFHKIASVTIDPAYLPLLQGRRVYPIDLVAETGATGRLVRGLDVPPWHAQVVKYFALQAGLDPYELWLLIEGERPEDSRNSAFIWLGSLLMLFLAAFLLIRAIVARRRERLAPVSP